MTKPATTRKQKAITIGSYLLGALFIIGGATKLAGLGSHAEHFAGWGFPVWFLYVVGATEVAGGALLLSKRSRFIGAITLAATMVGAVGTHVVANELAQTAPAAAFLIATSAIAYATRDQLQHILGRVRRAANNE